MIDCPDFLDRYSEFRDQLLDAEEHADFVRHLARCESCARYDRVVSGGIDTLLRLPEVSVSAGFVDRLDYRLTLLDAAQENRALSGTPVALMMAVAVAIGAAAWLPALRDESQPLRLPPTAAHAPYHPQNLPLVYHPGLLPVPATTTASFGAGYGAPNNFSPYSLLGTPPAASQSRVAHASR